VGTTKLTRKEILAEDPVHEAILRLVEFLRAQGKTIALAVVSMALLAVGIYFGLQYLDSRENQAQTELSRAIDMYHGQIDAAALDDPYGKGPVPTFRSDTAKYEATEKACSALISKYGSSKQGIIARYYLGLSQLQLGQEKDAVASLESVRDNTKDRTVAYLAKKVLALHYLDKGNYRGAEDLLSGMIKDPQCDLPKADLRVDLARTYAAEGKKDQAIKVLREGRESGGSTLMQYMIGQELTKLESTAQPSTLKP
jgi:predicted negative regulator of RcsB-dependent stress response